MVMHALQVTHTQQQCIFFLLTDIFGEAAGKIPAWTTNFPRIKKLYDPRGPTRREWDASALL